MNKKGIKIEGHLLKLKALSDETRLNIINLLSTEPLCACDILESFNISQPTLSYHMNLLSESGLVSAKRDGKWMYYSLNKEQLCQLMDYLNLISTTPNVTLVKSSHHCGTNHC